MAGSPRSRGALEVRAEHQRVARTVHLPLQAFIRTEWLGSGVLLAAAVVALVLANSPAADAVHRLWETRITLDLGFVQLSKSMHYWVNDGLMALFFFVVGLEIKREILHGHLSDPRTAALPAAAALGGMVVPALVYVALNAGGPGVRGWAVPMATDIAFALGVLGLLGRRVPTQLRVFVLALAIVDDLGTILMIAVFYTENIVVGAFGAAALVLAAIVLARILGIRSVPVYALLGFFFWVAILKSGVHATLAGVVLGLLTPARHYYDDRTALEVGRRLLARFEAAVERDDHHDIEATLGRLEEVAVGTESPLERLERKVHPWTAFVVLPLFALVNAGVPLSPADVGAAMGSPVALGIVAALVLGKLGGIFLAAWLAVKLRLARLPEGVGWRHVAGAAQLAGIGFTVALFIAELAFVDEAMMTAAKIGILAASLAAGISGYLLLRVGSRPPPVGAADGGA